MNRHCRCGGIIKRDDIVNANYSKQYGRRLYYLILKVPGTASFKCNKCLQEYKQRLRRSA